MDAREAANRWRDAWLRSWPVRDAQAITATYAPEHVYRSHPLRDPEGGGVLGFVTRAFADEEPGTECWFGEPIVDGDRAAMQYWAILNEVGSGTQTLSGVSVLRFRADGLVVEHTDYWAMQPGRLELPSGWAHPA